MGVDSEGAGLCNPYPKGLTATDNGGAMSNTITPIHNELALVLGGGGARAAYQVGLMRCLARRRPELRFPIVTGVSAGAINAAFRFATRGLGTRETEWRQPSFLRDLFLGRFRLDLINPFPEPPERPEFRRFLDRFSRFLREEVDSAAIDASGEYPPELLRGLKELGAFGMKIPKEYGGLGLSQWEYGRVMALLGSVDGNITALLSAHQSIGVPQPVRYFGTEEQKQRFLPRRQASRARPLPRAVVQRRRSRLRCRPTHPRGPFSVARRAGPRHRLHRR